MATVSGLSDVAVFGIPDAKWGQVVAAIFVGTTSIDELVAHASLELAAYKVPRLWLMVDEIPRTAMGKVVRSMLAEKMFEAIADGVVEQRGPHRS
jgi:acyl-CoA synthetase (AMP-forming)/AMP-acid ligase II